jgi:glyoxylase-like metal-dependent hydrolase (beta-lactamase superfamily II)
VWWAVPVLVLLLAGPATAEYAMAPVEVAPGVYAVITPTRELPNPENRGWNSNSAFVVTGQGVLVFDTGSSAAIGEALREAISGITDEPVRWVVNSHGHGDHWLGNAAFAHPELEIIASPQVRARIEREGTVWVERFARMTDGATGDSRILVPNTLIDAPTGRRFGEIEVQILPSGSSHSPGDLMLWLPGRGVLIAGDVVYSDRMPSTNEADVRQWRELLSELIAMEPAVVIPGHGKLTDLEGLRRLQDLLEAFWIAVEQGYAAGKADYEMVADVLDALATYRPYYPGLEEKVRRDLPHVYLRVEAANF